MKPASPTKPETRLAEILSSYDSLAVAFSGGVDSTLLAVMAKKYVKGKVLIINVVSPFSTMREISLINRLVKEYDFTFESIELNPLESEQIRNNPADRCYHCKKMLMSEIIRTARKHGIGNVADGTNIDDLEDYRPGNKASDELGIRHPFIEGEITKHQIRDMAKGNGIENWNLPSSACLASRIPYNTPITEGDLRKIEKAEDYLHSSGYDLCRVRKLGDSAKIEIEASQFEKILADRTEMIDKIKSIGFKNVYLDLEGYRQGALNKGI